MEIGRIPGSAIPLRYSLQHVSQCFVPPMASTSYTSYTNVVAHSNLSEFKSKNRMFILGMGFVSQSLAHKLRDQGWDVSGTCTSHMKKKKLEDKGFRVYLFDADELEPSALDVMKDYTHLLVSVPPVVGIGDLVLQHEDLLRSSLVTGNLQWLGYLSSTGVYGDFGGELVDEDYPTKPSSQLAKLRLASEAGWSNLARHLGFSPQVFRLGGIYGPGRSAIDTIIKQEPLSEGQKMRKNRKYTSRVHIEDICQALMAAIYTPSSKKIYNIVDDDPAPREVVFEYARKLVEKKWPGLIRQPTEELKSSIIETRNERGEKRVSNARMKQELGVRLLYPDYRSGLQSIIDQMETPFHGAHSHLIV
ncbi:hypothetical protein L6164_015326 [Bauhinia variegata]|uniref:Uncharacterized protein n=1 Tax=Bauhinia variegata TaxID=167791 RepID=A0ACB9NKT6_BAUVA|nr:hypothetical protein L6164_015326 [Bauhinia variegata]